MITHHLLLSDPLQPVNIVAEIFGGYTPKMEHPAFEGVVVRINMLDMVNPDLVLAGRDLANFKTIHFCKIGVAAGGIRANHGIFCDAVMKEVGDNRNVGTDFSDNIR